MFSLQSELILFPLPTWPSIPASISVAKASDLARRDFWVVTRRSLLAQTRDCSLCVSDCDSRTLPVSRHTRRNVLGRPASTVCVTRAPVPNRFSVGLRLSSVAVAQSSSVSRQTKLSRSSEETCLSNYSFSTGFSSWEGFSSFGYFR